MPGVLDGMRIVEGSAFVAVPLGGMTLAQLGADVIRFDPIGGGLDYGRWPVTLDGKKSLFWAGFNKPKATILIRPSKQPVRRFHFGGNSGGSNASPSFARSGSCWSNTNMNWPPCSAWNPGKAAPKPWLKPSGPPN